MKFIIFLTLSALAIKSQGQTQALERILGFIPSLTTLHVRVYSGGCTEKSDFRYEIQELAPGKGIIFYRTRPDDCRPFIPTGKTLRYSYSELGLSPGDRFKILNPIRDGFVW